MARNNKGCGCGTLIVLSVTIYIATLYVKKMKEEKSAEPTKSPAAEQGDR